jgi:uncharacterized protein YegJ (DUF2314 family)
MELISAQEMQKKHPETFCAPSIEELKTINTGFIVKVSNGQERFWVKVVKIDKDLITGIIDNNLISTEGYDCGDTISFTTDKVYDIYTD